MLMACAVFPQCSQAASHTEVAGDILQLLIPAAGYTTTLLMHDAQGQTQFHQSFLSSLGITFALKFAVGRERPDGSNHRSFPSGHTSSAFQGAAFIHQRYGWQYATAAYLGAAFVGYSRVDANKHFASDVIAGAVVGTLSSFYFTKSYKGFAITPTANNGAYGLRASRQW